MLSGVVNFDDFYFDNVKIECQQFAEIVKEKGDVFKESSFDGIIGLGYPNMAAYGFQPLFDNIIN